MNYNEAIKVLHGLVYAYTNILMLIGILTFIGGIASLKQLGSDEQNGMQMRQGSLVAITITAFVIGIGLIYFGTVVDNTTSLMQGRVLLGSQNPLSWTASGAIQVDGTQETLAFTMIITFFQVAGVFAMGSGWSGFLDAAELYGAQRRQIVKASLAKMIAGSFLLIPDSFVGMFAPIVPMMGELANYINQHRLV